MTLGAIPESRVPQEYELEKQEKFHSQRVVLLAIDHGPNSKRAFDWALKHFLTAADELHLLHVLPRLSNNPISCSSPRAGSSDESPIYEATQLLIEKLVKEAYDICKMNVVSIIRDGDVGKEICAEAARLQPTAVIMGSRGLGRVKSLLIGSATEYCSHHCPVPLVIVPHNYEAVEENNPHDSETEASP